MTRRAVAEELAQLRSAGLFRDLKTIASPQGPHVRLDAGEPLLLCSNNYLGLAEDPRVRAAAADAAEQFGAGAGASRSVSGTMAIHERLEQSLADFKGTESALLFGSGYLANIGVLVALAADGVVYSDALNHASIIDGCRLAGARTVVYDHCDVADLRQKLAMHPVGEPAVIVTDSVFSMDGDIAPLQQLADVAAEFEALLVVDEAHGTGCVGPGGRGALAAASAKADVIVGTLGKALGSYGAYAACSAQLRDLLINRARTFIFATAPPPPSVGAAQAALEVLMAEPELVERLQDNARVLRESLASLGLPIESSTQILPLVIGAPEAAVAAADYALAQGVFAQAIRPPTVAPGTSRLRLTVMASHDPDDLRAAAAVISEAVAR